MQIVPINNGYSFIKSNFGLTFKSSHRETTLSEYGCSCDILSLDGIVYAVGDGNPSIDKDKTSNIATKLFVLNVLCKRMQNKESEHFKVALTAPPMTFSKQKDSLPKYLIGSYNVFHNGKQKEIFIDNVVVYPETIMAYLANNPTSFNRGVLVIDIGGLTSNVAYIQNGTYNKDSIISFPNGMYHVESEVCDYLNEKYWDLSLDETLIYEFLEKGLFLEDGTVNIVEEEKDGINAIYNKYVGKIFHKIDMKGWSPKTTDILVTGGGGKILYETIKKKFSHAKLSNNPIFDNLKGMEELIARENNKQENNRKELSISGVNR